MNTTPRTTSDDVMAQLRDLERQGGGMARLAHVAAGLLLVAFSVGSLISISNAAFFRFLAQWNGGVFDLPDAISLAVNILLVVCADVGLLYAASVLRTLVAAQAPRSEQRVHRYAMIGAAALESASYLYLVWMFDRPSTIFLWAIGITRALAAPLFAAYLSMARPLPVGPRDVAYQTALASGKGLVRDVTALAGDPDASLERKVRIFTAASIMSAQDRTRFDGIIQAVSETEPAAQRADVPAIEAPETPTRPPTGPGSPTVARKVSRPVRTPPQRVIELPPAERRQSAAQASASRTHSRRVRTDSREADARAAWERGARSVSAMERSTGMSRATAAKWVRMLKAEQSGKAVQ